MKGKGERMSATDSLQELYHRFYEQREVLTQAPQLTQAPDSPDFDWEKADNEISQVVSYLMGVPDIRTESFERCVEIIQQHYDNQQEWKELLVDYLDYLAEKEEESLRAQQEAVFKKIEEAAQYLSEDEEEVE